MQSIFITVVKRTEAAKKGKKPEVFEEVSIRGKLSKRNIEESTFILDLVNKSIVKNRYAYSSEKEYTYESVMEYLRKHHKNVVDVEKQYDEVLAAVNSGIAEMTKMAEEADLLPEAEVEKGV